MDHDFRLLNQHKLQLKQSWFLSITWHSLVTRINPVTSLVPQCSPISMWCWLNICCIYSWTSSCHVLHGKRKQNVTWFFIFHFFTSWKNCNWDCTITLPTTHHFRTILRIETLSNEVNGFIDCYWRSCYFFTSMFYCLFKTCYLLQFPQQPVSHVSHSYGDFPLFLLISTLEFL